jgi:C4-dicarboxylate-specific signal transduction histidine kinase
MPSNAVDVLPAARSPRRSIALRAVLAANLVGTLAVLALELGGGTSRLRIALALSAFLGCALTGGVAAALFFLERRREREASAASAATAEAAARSEQCRAEGERQAAVGGIAAELGHDLASPVASATANLRFAEVELSGSGTDPEVIDAVREAREALERVRRVLSDLRALAPEAAGEVADVDLEPAVGQGLRLAAARLGPLAELAARLPPGLPLVQASPPHLAHLVSVLVSAAAGGDRPGTSPSAPVDLEALVGREAVQLAVTGASAGRGGRAGAGLGVALCRELARRWGGRVEAGHAPDGRPRLAVTLRRAAPGPAVPNVG